MLSAALMNNNYNYYIGKKGVNINMTIGERLKSLRIGEKKTLKQQSEKFKVSTNSVYRWEHNLATPRMPMLKRLAEHYKVPLSWLISDQTADEKSVEEDLSAFNNETEQQLFKLYHKLPLQDKYKALGYITQLYLEHMEAAGADKKDKNNIKVIN